MALFSILFVSFFNFAQVSSTSDAMGGTGVAYASAVDSAFLNPAGISFFSDIHFSGAYRFGKSVLGDMQQMHAVIADANPENLFKGSLAYRERKYEPGADDVKEQDFIANAAYAFTPGFGVGVRGYKKQTNVPLQDRVDQYNGDLGLLWRPGQYWVVGITQYGLLSTKDTLVQPLGVLPMTTAGALFTLPDIAVVTADISYAYKENTSDRFSHAIGVSFQNVEFLRTNLGARFDDRAGETVYSAGFQFWGPRLKVGYAYQKEVRKELGEMHTIDISMNL